MSRLNDRDRDYQEVREFTPYQLVEMLLILVIQNNQIILENLRETHRLIAQRR